MEKNSQSQKVLQVLLWIWFGMITAFAMSNTIKIVKLETDNKAIHRQVNNLNTRILHYQNLLSK